MYKPNTMTLGIWATYIRKLLFLMRLTTVVIILTMFQLSAATSFGQKISLVQDNIPMSKLFKEIKKQTGYNVLWDDEKFKATTVINANFKDTPIDEVLEFSLKGFPLTYEIKNKTILLKEKEKSFLDNLISKFAAIDVRGTVVDSTGKPLPGATVKVKGTNRSVITNENGEFFIENVDEKATLIISYLGFESREVGAVSSLGVLTLVGLSDDLKEVEIVSTGYQNIPKERATGSFTIIDTKTINRSVGINIIDRLEGVASGLLLNRGLGIGNNPKFSIHGRSTLFANAEPLIVLNGLPYEGTIDQINPAEVETINVLKDAAASSIWGSRSGNGVIVITTKTGKKNQRLTIAGYSTLTIINKPNLNYIPQMSSSDFVGLEQFLFENGFYTFNFFNPYSPISDAIDVFNKRKNNNISSADSASKINSLERHDVRDDLNRYIYRSKIQQQYQLNLNGGTENQQYYISGGYDKNLESRISDNYDRISLNGNNTYSLINERLEVSSDINFISSNTENNRDPYKPYSPYDRIVAEDGNSLSVIKDFRRTYLDTVGNGNLLDWHYRPIDDLSVTTHTRLAQIRIKVGLNFKVLKGLNISANYQILNENNDGKTDSDLDSYYARNLINTYSSFNNNIVSRIIPLGNILNEDIRTLKSKIFRTQIDFNKIIGKYHEIIAIAGYEGSDTRGRTNTQIYYGFDPETLTNANGTIDPLTSYKYYYGFGSGVITTAPSLMSRTDVNQSYYSNASYSYDGRYIVSGSVRKDESNLFGVKTNQEGILLWSTGVSWNINRENFYNINWLSILKLRATYGYNGNVDKTVSAFLTAYIAGPPNYFGNPYAVIQNPPNPSLRWEKIKTWNLGLDFSLKNNRLTGSIDAYQKKSTDLISNNPIPSQSGVVEFRGNGANLRTKGVDLILNSMNSISRFLWSTKFLLSYNNDKVTNYKVKQSSNSNIVNSNYENPLENYPYNAVYSFPSAGLDDIGSPQGYFNGTVSKEYAKIRGVFDPSQIKYHGSALPRYFGSLINTFAYKQFEISINITYKFDYFFRRLNVFSGSNYGTSSQVRYELADYEKRWQKKGDEKSTRIPALIYPSNFLQDSFFSLSEDLVEKGDHFRLQDIKFSYNISNRLFSSLSFKKVELFAYTRNLGILWRANNLNIDPDYGTTSIPQPFSCSLGINFSL